MDNAARERLRLNLSMADDEALVALANRGLLRRAQKDLEQDTQLTIEESDDALLVRGPGWCVTMPPEGPATARDDSGATGVTRFILAATIYLREHWSIPTDSSAITREVKSEENDESGQHSALRVHDTAHDSAIGTDAPSSIDAAVDLLVGASIDELVKWSGKGVFLQATARLNSLTGVVIQQSPMLTIDFVGDSTRVLLMSDRPERTMKRLLDQFKTTAAKSELAFWVVLAVLVLKRRAGEDLSNIHVLESDITQAIRDDRLRLAQRCQKLLSSATVSGLAHPSSRLIERFETLAVGAEAARFPRLARLLNSIASDIQLQIQRSAAADPQRIVERVLMARALCKAALMPVNSERAELYGRSRSHYLPGGNVEVDGLGAYAWRADSGYEGVTAIFWDQAGQRFLTASQARGESQDRSFSLALAYELGLGWTGSQSLKSHCRQRLRIEDTKLNWDGRLSSSASCSVANIGTTNVEQINFGDRLMTEWTVLTERGRQLQPLGLRVPSSRDALFVIKPTEWGRRWFDELAQEFVWDLFDRSVQLLQVRVPWNELEESSIEFLETIKPERENLWGLLGRINIQQSRLSIYPLSLLLTGGSKGDTVLCPHFDQDRLESRNKWLLERLRAKYGRGRNVQTKIAEIDDEDLSINLQAIPKTVRDLLTDIQAVLHGAIEAGAVQLNELTMDQLRASQHLAASLGLRTLESSIKELLFIQQATVQSGRDTNMALAGSVLDAAYATQLAARAAASLCL